VTRLAVFVLPLALVLLPAPDPVPAWTWPVQGPLVAGFDPPDSPYGAGHRGIDIAAAVGTVVLAPEAGVISFAGPVGGRLFVSIDHGGGLVSTVSWLSEVRVRKGATVARGDPIATTGWGHAEAEIPNLHFGVRLDGTYVDPLAYLAPPQVSGFIRLAPLPSDDPS
jgi:murein DD-endopeptidase MepM/ murein hydrolase activator NlpD